MNDTVPASRTTASKGLRMRSLKAGHDGYRVEGREFTRDEGKKVMENIIRQRARDPVSSHKRRDGRGAIRRSSPAKITGKDVIIVSIDVQKCSAGRLCG